MSKINNLNEMHRANYVATIPQKTCTCNQCFTCSVCILFAPIVGLFLAVVLGPDLAALQNS